MRTSSREPTPRQKQILQIFLDRRDANETPPTVRELMEGFDMESPNGVICHLAALVRKGFLVHRPYRTPAYVLDIERCPSRLEEDLKEAKEIILLLMQEAMPIGELARRIDSWMDRVDKERKVAK